MFAGDASIPYGEARKLLLYNGWQINGFWKGFPMNSATHSVDDATTTALDDKVLFAAFDKAGSDYKAAPNAHTLLSLNKAAIPLMSQVVRDKPWKMVGSATIGDTGSTIACDFTAIRVVADVRLDAVNIMRLAGCLGYALKATLVGDELGEPSASYAQTKEDTGVMFTLIEFAYDASSTARTRPDVRRAFEVARDTILNGSPIRTTDREGAGTRNTRLAEGITAPANLTFYVR